MEVRTLTAGPAAAGQRLDRWLAAACDDLSRSALQSLIEEGRVTVDGRPANKKNKLRGGETITLTLPDPQPIEAQPQNIPLEIVYEDAHLLVVNKPKGMVVHPAPRQPGRHAGQRAALPLRGEPFGHWRGDPPRHCPPDR